MSAIRLLAAAALGRALTAVTFIEGRPGSGDEVKRELLSLTAPTRGRSGTICIGRWTGRAGSCGSRSGAMAALEAHKQTPHLRASFERRKNAGWMTEITRWERVPEERGTEAAAR